MIILRRFIARRFNYLVEKIYSLKISMLTLNEPPIVILTPGKVGSASVYKTLKKNLKNQVFHIHRFSKEGIEESAIEHIESDRNSRPLHLIVAKLLRKKLQRYKGKIFIITIVREPISRAISSFFQNTEFYKTEIEKRGLRIDKTKAQKLLLKKLKSGITDDLENWFENEINGNFSINLISEPFKNKGYKIVRKNNFHLLLLKMETLDNYFPKAIQELIGLDQAIPLQRANIGEEKHYSESYKVVKNRIQLSGEQLDEIISSKYFQQFYPQQEYLVKQKWGEKIPKE